MYMTAEVRYTVAGRLRKLLFQPRCVNILQITGGDGIYHRLVLPIARSPMLMSRTCVNNEELLRFVTGRVGENTRVKKVVLMSDGTDVERDVVLRFYRFANYRRAE